MRVLMLAVCFLFIHGVSVAEGPESLPEAPSAEKKAVEAPAEEQPLPELPKEEKKKPEVAIPKAPSKEEEEKTEVVTPEPEEKKQKKEEKWINIEGGFAYRNVSLHQGSYTFVTQFDGEILNKSGMDYSIVKFVFGTYDARGRLITEEAFHVIDFNNGQTKTFKGTAVDGFKEIASFKIRLKSGVAAAVR